MTPWYLGLEHCVREQVPLGPMTTYKVGGPAQYFAEPQDDASLAALLRRARECNIPLRILGHGSNLLVSDAGVEGLTIRLPRGSYQELERTGNTLLVGAGYSLPGLVNWSIGRGMSGMECLVGVPGTVGAALRMNAGGKYGEIGTRVKWVEGFELDGTPFRFDRGACGFVYRGSGFDHRLVTRCEMELEDGDPAAGKERARGIVDEKRKSQPLAARSAGCVFKNPKIPGVPPAGKLIDDLGLKGKRIGGAAISDVHANFLVCDGPGAKAADLAELIRLIRTRVRDERGIELHLEIAAWGFQEKDLGAA